MARSAPISMTLPPFAGATRKLVLANIAVFFSLALAGWVAPHAVNALMGHLALVPAMVARGEIWQLVTYSFLPMGLIGTLFAMLTLWFFGSYLEGIFGSRWMYEFYFVSIASAALLASAITFTHALDLRPDLIVLGAAAATTAVLVAFATVAGEQEIRFMFIIRMKAKYLVAIYLIFTLAVLLKGQDRFGALNELCCALTAYGFMKLAPRKGVGYAFTEHWFGIRNDYYRWKRRRAAKKFAVYMKKQNREVHFDADGRYVDPDTGQVSRRDPNDRRWMN